MYSSKERFENEIKNRKGDTVAYGVVGIKNSEQFIKIETSQIYSQIARTSRKTNKKKEMELLILALENSYIEKRVNGRLVRKDPIYVTMRVDDAEQCFGNRFKNVIKNGTFCHA